ncbi:MAG: TetR/AcrR family transcriptional regulator [Chloroflexi bacterium]|nr:MAG: TetR/AcrR family transcriptional regulator [Chloroflexota bacterium]
MTSTRQQIIEKTSQLLERQGYHATGLNQIVAESETPRGSLYYYFPQGKEELAAEAVEFKARQMSEYMRRLLATHADPVEAIYWALLNFADHMDRGGCRGGAPIASVALETAGSSERLRESCHLAYGFLVAPVQEKLVAAGYPMERAEALALTISAALEGGMILSRTEQSSRPLRIIAEEIRTMLLCTTSVL